MNLNYLGLATDAQGDWFAASQLTPATPSVCISGSGISKILPNGTHYRHHSGSLTRAAFLSARNDALANVAIIVAGLVTAVAWHSAWPDLIVGLAIAAMNADAAREVWSAAREEHQAAA